MTDQVGFILSTTVNRKLQFVKCHSHPCMTVLSGHCPREVQSGAVRCSVAVVERGQRRHWKLLLTAAGVIGRKAMVTSCCHRLLGKFSMSEILWTNHLWWIIVDRLDGVCPLEVAVTVILPDLGPGHR